MRPLLAWRVRLIRGLLLVLLRARVACLRLGGHADTVDEVGLSHEEGPFAGRPARGKACPVRRGHAWQGCVGSAAGVPRRTPPGPDREGCRTPGGA